jgi:hypothetical protein
VKDLHVKKPGGWFWTPLSEVELDQRLGAGVIQREWRLWRDGESDVITVGEFLDRNEKGWIGPQGLDPSIETKPVATGNRERVMLQLLSIYIICSFLYRVLVTAHEYPMRPSQVLTIALDLVGVIALIGLKVQIFKDMPSGQPEWMTGRVLFWIALFAGVGRLLIRLNGDASWWTGHLFYEIEMSR